MKKLSRIAALLAAGALLFGAAGCSGDDDGGDPPPPRVDVTEDTVKGTYTWSGAGLTANKTLVFVGGNIYLKNSDATEPVNGNGSVKYTLAYTSDATTTDGYSKVGTYEIANGRVTGKMIVDEDTSFNATADTDDAGHLKSFTVSFSGEELGDGDKATATEASWNLVGTDADKAAGKKTYGGLLFDGDDVKLMAGNINADTGNLKIVIGSTGKGTAAAAGDKKKTIGDGLGATSANTYARFKPNNVKKGLVFKYDAITIPDVKGKVKLTIECYNSKADADHQLDVIYGDTVESKVLPKGGSETKFETPTYNLDFAEATPVYISTSEEFFFRTIKIEAVN